MKKIYLVLSGLGEVTMSSLHIKRFILPVFVFLFMVGTCSVSKESGQIMG
jgi:hypothetical protein